MDHKVYRNKLHLELFYNSKNSSGFSGLKIISLAFGHFISENGYIIFSFLFTNLMFWIVSYSRQCHGRLYWCICLRNSISTCCHDYFSLLLTLMLHSKGPHLGSARSATNVCKKRKQYLYGQNIQMLLLFFFFFQLIVSFLSHSLNSTSSLRELKKKGRISGLVWIKSWNVGMSLNYLIILVWALSWTLSQNLPPTNQWKV